MKYAYCIHCHLSLHKPKKKYCLFCFLNSAFCLNQHAVLLMLAFLKLLFLATEIKLCENLAADRKILHIKVTQVSHVLTITHQENFHIQSFIMKIFTNKKCKWITLYNITFHSIYYLKLYMGDFEPFYCSRGCRNALHEM